MNEEEIKEIYKGLKRNKKIIGTIDKDFFFEFAETVLNLLEKKDKIIDEMTEWIEKHTKYYDEDGCYCEVEKDICNKTIDCKDCIKQYFERRVENGN